MTELRIITPSAPLHSGPAAYASLDNEGLFGETFTVTGTKNDFRALKPQTDWAMEMAGLIFEKTK